MDTAAPRCLLCLVKVEPGTIFNEDVAESSSQCQWELEKREPVNKSKSVTIINKTSNLKLKRQLDVFFLLRHVLQLPLTHLKRYLKVRGNPAEWISLCGSCDDLVKNVREIFIQLQRISNKYDEARMKIGERIKATSLIKVVETGNDFILDECRQIVCKRKRSTFKRVSFLEGDSKAQRLLNNYRQKREFEMMKETSQTEKMMGDDPVELPSASPSQASQHLMSGKSLEAPETFNSQIIELEEQQTEINFETFDDHFFEDHESDSEKESKDAIQLLLQSTNKRSLRIRKQVPSKPASKTEVMRKRRKKGSRSKLTIKRTKTPRPRIKLSEAELRKRLTCKFCEKKFPQKRNLTRHLFRVHNYYEGTPPKTYTCTVEGCEKLFKYRCSYLDHMECHKLGVKPTCTICNTEFTSQLGLDMHDLIVHKIVKPSTQHRKFYDCQKCKKRFNSEIMQKKHILNCRGKKPEGPLECDICQTMCATSKDLRIHKKFKHSIIMKETEEEMEPESDPEPDPDNDFPCQHCGKIFRGDFALDYHVKIVHPTDEPKHICTICPDKKYRVISELKRHLAMSHNIGIEDYKCFCCGKVCRSKAKKRRHVCGVDDGPSNVCPICGKEFAMKQNLKRHISDMHEADLKISCNLCDFRTPRDIYLQYHLASKHQIGIKCEVENCTRYFATQKMLEDHVKKIHPQGEREDKFLCTECGKGFYDKRALNVHIKMKHPK